MNHEIYIKRCVELAKSGCGKVAPNPMVGSVLVYDNEIIGEGYHEQYGGPHAEVNCINSVKPEKRELIPLSTIYVSLEPCAHYGKTPPCADLIVSSGIKKVVIGTVDSFAKVAGRGIARLRNHDIEVISGILEQECLALNKRFFTFHEKKRPYIILKWAQNSAGIIGMHSSQRMFISNPIVNRLVHKWRSEEPAILAGKFTALYDDPTLTTRLWPGSNLLRVLMDRNLSVPAHSRIFNSDARTLVFNCLRNEGDLIKLPQANFLEHGVDYLYSIDIQSIIVEGGAQVLQSFIDGGLWDEARIIEATASQITGSQNLVYAPRLKNALLFNESLIDTNKIYQYKNINNGYLLPRK